MVYDKCFTSHKEYFLRIDSITAIDEDIFYFTTNSPFPFPNDSESDSLLDIQNIKNKILYFSYK